MAKETTTKTPKKRKKRSRKSVNSLSKVNLKGFVKEAKKPLLFIGGMYLGNKVYAFVNEKTNTVEGIFGVDGNKIIAPAVTALVGLTAAQMIKNPDFKFVAYGVTAVAGVKAAKEFFNQDILAGLGEADGSGVELPGAAPTLSLEELENKFDEIDNEVDNDGINGGANNNEDVIHSEYAADDDYVEIR